MKAPLFLLASALFGAVTVLACEDPKRPPVAEDTASGPGGRAAGGGNPDASAPAKDAGGGDDTDAGCTDLENTGVLHDQNNVVAALPTGTGGTIAEGTYDLTDAVLYQDTGGAGGPTGQSYQGSIRITGTASASTGATFERVMKIVSAATPTPTETAVRGTIQVAGVNGIIGLSCPFGATENLTYSVLDSSLTLTNTGTKESFVFTKQP